MCKPEAIASSQVRDCGSPAQDRTDTEAQRGQRAIYLEIAGMLGIKGDSLGFLSTLRTMTICQGWSPEREWLEETHRAVPPASHPVVTMWVGQLGAVEGM